MGKISRQGSRVSKVFRFGLLPEIHRLSLIDLTICYNVPYSRHEMISRLLWVFRSAARSTQAAAAVDFAGGGGGGDDCV